MFVCQALRSFPMLSSVCLCVHVSPIHSSIAPLQTFFIQHGHVWVAITSGT
jgi:hypothetical protein